MTFYECISLDGLAEVNTSERGANQVFGKS